MRCPRCSVHMRRLEEEDIPGVRVWACDACNMEHAFYGTEEELDAVEAKMETMAASQPPKELLKQAAGAARKRAAPTRARAPGPFKAIQGARCEAHRGLIHPGYDELDEALPCVLCHLGPHAPELEELLLGDGCVTDARLQAFVEGASHGAMGPLWTELAWSRVVLSGEQSYVATWGIWSMSPAAPPVAWKRGAPEPEWGGPRPGAWGWSLSWARTDEVLEATGGRG